MTIPNSQCTHELSSALSLMASGLANSPTLYYITTRGVILSETLHRPSVPHLEHSGPGAISLHVGMKQPPSLNVCYEKLSEHLQEKESAVSHWGSAGPISEKMYPLYLNGFAENIVTTFPEVAGRQDIVRNIPVSCTAIFNVLVDVHCRMGFPAVYTYMCSLDFHRLLNTLTPDFFVSRKRLTARNC